MSTDYISLPFEVTKIYKYSDGKLHLIINNDEIRNFPTVRFISGYCKNEISEISMLYHCKDYYIMLEIENTCELSSRYVIFSNQFKLVVNDSNLDISRYSYSTSIDVNDLVAIVADMHREVLRIADKGLNYLISGNL
jgi:hypothetical protein